MALVLPVDEDSLLFRVCLYVGVALLLTDIFIPLVFRRRIRLVLPWQRAHDAPARRLWLPQRGGRRPVNTQPHDAILQPHQQPRTELYRNIIRVSSLVFVVQQYEATAKPQPLRLPTLC
ncbi:hypothetical protein P43SY_005875 [Pythium insidiosum]|uniref:Uncharacterized protein n=1 Tax=Pythium insidiosum TaxID=114742 RepID=A0AAD5LUJ8_PYTIN|nr:hypothetical protein P43SY_005875 [Pythium insidiosum]